MRIADFNREDETDQHTYYCLLSVPGEPADDDHHRAAVGRESRGGRTIAHNIV